jgi:hypothetical protein
MSDVIPFNSVEAGRIMEQVLIRGDLAQLNHAERARYYTRICESLGLNALTRPFDYLTLNGKLQLYALKGCTDQLRRLHGVSISVVAQKETDGLLTIHVRALTADGRQDEDFGVVSLPDTMKGDTKANQIMKAITKAKRRVTLSICGLGLLDESELETIPESARQAKIPARIQRNLDRLKPRELPPPIDELPDHSAAPKADSEPTWADLVNGGTS